MDIINSLPPSNSTKKAEIFNLSATITSCSTMKPGEYNTTDVRHRRFHELAARCAILEREIEGGSCGQFESRQKYLDAFDSYPEISEHVQEMRDIAEQVVGLSMRDGSQQISDGLMRGISSLMHRNLGNRNCSCIEVFHGAQF